MTACEAHPDREAVGACTGCGRFVCAGCRVTVSPTLCPACSLVPRGQQPIGAPASPRARRGSCCRPTRARGRWQAPTLARGPLPPISASGLARYNPMQMMREPPTHAQRLAWLPIAGFLWALALLGQGAWWGYVAAAPVALASCWGAIVLRRRHRSERFRQKALTLFRRLDSPTVTKHQIVHDYGVNPDNADRILAWLVTEELLVADWTDNIEQPVVYKSLSGS